MSRIDQAMKRWEAAKGVTVPQATVVEAGSSSPLTHYPLEEEGTPIPEAPPQPSTFDAAEEAPVVTAPRAKRERPPANGEIEARLVTGALSSVPLEQYRRLAAVLHEEQVHSHLKTVMITSALPSEGKTLTIINLALTLSGSYGRRVLVVDADLRAPALHRVLGVSNRRGLGEALRDRHGELPIVEASPRLSVLTAGRPGPTPLADLTSDRMGEILRDAAATFDWVLIDTPPVGLLPDAQVLARLAGAVVFVIAAGVTPASAVERAVAEIGSDSIIGTVLNRVDDRRIPEANYYNEYYGHYSNQ